MPTTICGTTDLLKGLIPNKVVLIALIAGVVFHIFFGNGILFALTGIFFGFAAGMLGFVLRGIGGGDVKLMTALGAWTGLYSLYWIMLIAAAIGVAWGIAALMRRRELLNKIKGVSLYGPLRQLPEDINAPLPADAIPFGTCLALASWLISVKYWAGV